jgi:hypothetical protein
MAQAQEQPINTLNNGLAFQQLYTKKIIPKEEWASIFGEVNIDINFQIKEIFEIENKIKQKQFDLHCELITQQLNGGNPNVKKLLFHSPNPIYIDNILNNGLDIAFSKKGFYGNAICLTNSILKANDYSKSKGDPNAIRTMLICSAVLGKIKKYPNGQFDKELFTAPEDSHSIEGFIRRATEYGVYNNNQIIITHMITYRYANTQDEISQTQLLANTNGKIVYITASLSEFLARLEQRTPDADKLILKENISLLLKQIITVEQFIINLEDLLKSKAPTDIAYKIKMELVKCNLQPIQNALAAPALAAPAPALAAPALAAPALAAPALAAPVLALAPPPSVYAPAPSSTIPRPTPRPTPTPSSLQIVTPQSCTLKRCIGANADNSDDSIEIKEDTKPNFHLKKFRQYKKKDSK